MDSKLIRFDDERRKSMDATTRLMARLLAWLPVREQGSALMMGVAVLWSFTSSFDKIGLLHSHSNTVYLALNRLVMGVPSLAYLVWKVPDALG